MSSTQKQKYQAYAAATQTVAKTRQIVMLYEGTIRFVQQAKEAIREKRIEDRYHLLIKASAVIEGLQSCLDFEQGGDIAKVLYHFYASVDSRIFSIHRTNDMHVCDEIIADLKQMRDVWHEIDRTSNPVAAMPATGGRNGSETSAAANGDVPENVTFSA